MGSDAFSSRLHYVSQSPTTTHLEGSAVPYFIYFAPIALHSLCLPVKKKKKMAGTALSHVGPGVAFQ